MAYIWDDREGILEESPYYFENALGNECVFVVNAVTVYFWLASTGDRSEWVSGLSILLSLRAE